jgi:hypothetical protein
MDSTTKSKDDYRPMAKVGEKKLTLPNGMPSYPFHALL